MYIDLKKFYNKGGVLNRNKLRESWIKNNLPKLYSSVISYKLPTDISHFSQKIYHYIHNMFDYPKCEYCNGYNKRYVSFTTGYMDCCSKKCALSLVRPQIEETRRINTLLRHGVKHTSVLISTKRKQKETNERIYGYVSPACDVKVQKKMKITNIKRYDVEYVMQNENIKNNYKNNRRELSMKEVKYNYKLNIIDYDGDLFKIRCGKCNDLYSINRSNLYQRIEKYKTDPCTVCNPLGCNKSSYENELYEYLNNSKVNIIRNHRIDNREMDIYLPDYNLGIEVNGLYWHSENKRGRNYHIEKTKFFKSHGIDILHIWEDDWLCRKNIVKSIISDKLNINDIKKIDSINCVVKKISNKCCKEFLMCNDIFGSCNVSLSFGLFYKSELISVMSFSKINKCIDGKYVCEIIRFCDKLLYKINGSGSMIFNHFMENNEVIEVFVSVSCDYHNIDSNEYINMGFILDMITKPDYYWCYNMVRYDKNNFTKVKLVKEGYNSDKTVYEIMLDRKYYKIWDSGRVKFRYVL